MTGKLTEWPRMPVATPWPAYMADDALCLDADAEGPWHD